MTWSIGFDMVGPTREFMHDGAGHGSPMTRWIGGIISIICVQDEAAEVIPPRAPRRADHG